MNVCIYTNFTIPVSSVVQQNCDGIEVFVCPVA